MSSPFPKQEEVFTPAPYPFTQEEVVLLEQKLEELYASSDTFNWKPEIHIEAIRIVSVYRTQRGDTPQMEITGMQYRRLADAGLIWLFNKKPLATFQENGVWIGRGDAAMLIIALNDSGSSFHKLVNLRKRELEKLNAREDKILQIESMLYRKAPKRESDEVRRQKCDALLSSIKNGVQ